MPAPDISDVGIELFMLLVYLISIALLLGTSFTTSFLGNSIFSTPCSIFAAIF